ncbi:replication fork protection component Swi3-domain-containing protein [Aspergillus multicolor]|uniref:Chromosome segregation in meiosis protein 3 n=1 Tax=Aspergillus multicolor TaxID=41759 RepID=UPI003CCD2051
MANETNLAAEAAQSTDYVDDLFDYDVGLDDILQEINVNTSRLNQPKPSAQPDNSGVVLGLDEEVKVAKKRQPIAKLDEDRLLTQAGIQKLRRSARKNLKFKGKGNEFSDLARLLNFYQLWLDDLFPRAKFADGLAMIERLGHSKRLQTMRRTWIDEEKPKPADEALDNEPSATESRRSVPKDTPRSPGRLADMGVDEDLFIPDITNNQQSAHEAGSAPEDDEFDELDALLREHREEPDLGMPTSTGAPGTDSGPPNEDAFDELDALLREHEDEHDVANMCRKESKHESLEIDSHVDELEAMEGLNRPELR